MLEDSPPPNPPGFSFSFNAAIHAGEEDAAAAGTFLKSCCSRFDGGKKKRVLPFKLKIKINITEEKKKDKFHYARFLF